MLGISTLSHIYRKENIVNPCQNLRNERVAVSAKESGNTTVRYLYFVFSDAKTSCCQFLLRYCVVPYRLQFVSTSLAIAYSAVSVSGLVSVSVDFMASLILV